jgi:hypothetical protein
MCMLRHMRHALEINAVALRLGFMLEWKGMKIVVKTPMQLRTVTLRLPEPVMEEIDRLAEGNGVSRQRLIAEILKKAVGDKAFTVEIAVDRVKGDEE